MSSRKRERMEQTSHKVIEKRRRDRINNCLFELSQTVPAAFSKQTSGKLEKAEILEMTVEYLRAVQTTEIGMRFDNGEWFSTDIWGDFAHHYQTGYSECVREVLKYMADVEGVSVSDSRCARLVSFLHNRFRSADAASASAAHAASAGNGMPATGYGNSGVMMAAGSLGTYATSRTGYLASCADLVTSTSPRDVTVLSSAVKTVSSTLVAGSSTSFDARLLAAFPPPYLSAQASGNRGHSHSGRPAVAGGPLSHHPGSSMSLSLSTLSVAPPPSSPFRPLPSLSIPAVDLLRFPSSAVDVAAFLSGRPGNEVARTGRLADNEALAALPDMPHPRLGLSATVRTDACPSV